MRAPKSVYRGPGREGHVAHGGLGCCAANGRKTEDSCTSGGAMGLRCREPWRRGRRHPATMSGIHRPAWPVPRRMPDTVVASPHAGVGLRTCGNAVATQARPPPLRSPGLAMPVPHRPITPYSGKCRRAPNRPVRTASERVAGLRIGARSGGPEPGVFRTGEGTAGRRCRAAG